MSAEVEKTKAMEESMVKLDTEMRRSDELLSQMMPKSVAQKIKEGASAVETCEIFEMVTIVFNDIPMFGDICAQCDGMQIVAMLNNMFGMFDVLSDKNKVYKVETVKVIRKHFVLLSDRRTFVRLFCSNLSLGFLYSANRRHEKSSLKRYRNMIKNLNLTPGLLRGRGRSPGAH